MRPLRTLVCATVLPVLFSGCYKTSESGSANIPITAEPDPADSPPATAPPPAAELEEFVIKMPQPLDDAERAKKYDQPIDRFLRDNAIGHLVKGESVAGADGEIEYLLLTIAARPAEDLHERLIAELKNLGAPYATQVY